MKRAALIVCALLGTLNAAQAGFSQAELDTVSAAPAANARLPLSTRFIDESGKALTLGDAIGNLPTVVIFADFTCTNLCGPILAFAAGGLEKTGLAPGHDYRLVVIGLDPKDGIDEAKAMKASRIGQYTTLAATTLFLTGNAEAIRTTTDAAAYRYAYDAEHDQFAHPALAYIVSAQGRIIRTLSGLGLTGADLRLALVDASNGHTGTFADHVRLLCYGFDPELGIYTESITRWLAGGGIATVIALAGGILLLGFKTRRSTAP